MDAGADKDKGNNRMGWTPLHEACFYNRFDTVKLLLMNGCDATKRTCNNALPYHLCGMGAVRNLLKEMGGEGAVPEDSDKIDIIEILQELAICEENQFLTLLAEDDDDEDYEGILSYPMSCVCSCTVAVCTLTRPYFSTLPVPLCFRMQRR